MSNTKYFKKAFLTGCDENTQWMLPWFCKNFRRYHYTPLVFANFGVTEDFLENFVNKNFEGVIDLSMEKGQGWFLKPRAMLNVPAEKVVWLDTDCHILSNIDDIFNELEPEKLAMVKDHPWTKRRKELWHNSGVVGFINRPSILKAWFRAVTRHPDVGDQEVLHGMLNPITKIQYIKDLPHKYNVLRLDVDDGLDPEDKKVMHWTGKKGKDIIKGLMENE